MIETITHYAITIAQVVNTNDIKLPNKNVTLIGPKIQLAFQTISVIMGAIAVLIIAIAGFQYIISAGDSAKIAKAKDAIIYALIGLTISAFAFTIVTFVIGNVFR